MSFTVSEQWPDRGPESVNKEHSSLLGVEAAQTVRSGAVRDEVGCAVGTRIKLESVRETQSHWKGRKLKYFYSVKV